MTRFLPLPRAWAAPRSLRPQNLRAPSHGGRRDSRWRDRLFKSLGFPKRRLAPHPPMHEVARVLQEIRARGMTFPADLGAGPKSLRGRGKPCTDASGGLVSEADRRLRVVAILVRVAAGGNIGVSERPCYWASKSPHGQLSRNERPKAQSVSTEPRPKVNRHQQPKVVKRRHAGELCARLRGATRFQIARFRG
jgi:hypothetical protein